MTYVMDLPQHFHLRVFMSPRGTYASHQSQLKSIPNIMSQQHPHFHSKCLAKMYVAEKSIEEKNPFKVSRSDPRRYEVVCTDPDCLYRLKFRGKRMTCFTLQNHSTNTLAIIFLQHSKRCWCDKERQSCCDKGDELPPMIWETHCV